MALMYHDKGASKSGTQFDVLSGQLRIGYVGKEMLSAVTSHAGQWRWTLYVGAAPPGLERHGHADSCEGAKLAIENSWRAWLEATGLTDQQR